MAILTDSHQHKRQTHSYGAFTPDANEALSASDLHVKSMQRHNRHPAGLYVRVISKCSSVQLHANNTLFAQVASDSGVNAL